YKPKKCISAVASCGSTSALAPCRDRDSASMKPPRPSRGLRRVGVAACCSSTSGIIENPYQRFDRAPAELTDERGYSMRCLARVDQSWLRTFETGYRNLYFVEFSPHAAYFRSHAIYLLIHFVKAFINFVREFIYATQQ